MPERILCKECDEVLYEGDLLKSPHDVIKKYDEKCPKCGADLSFNAGEIIVEPNENE